MLPTIRIDEDVWSALQRQAIPFEDTPNSVLRRVLGLGQDRAPTSVPSRPQEGNRSTQNELEAPPRRSRSRIRRGEALPFSAYEQPILEILAKRGGSAPAVEVVDELGRRLADEFTQADRLPYPGTGEMRWRNRAQWTRYQLVQRGLLRADSPRGIWALTPEGEKYARGN